MKGILNMKYKLRAAVWEITMACNMRCKHCGSKCAERLCDELTTDEAIALCDELVEMKLDFITLSGGEPTTRFDWPLIAERLSTGGIKTSLITNGWLWDEDLIAKTIKAKVHSVAVSIDGLKETHDYIRREGSFERDMDTIHRLIDAGIHVAVITTVNKVNLLELDEMFKLFSTLGISVWQLQIAMPMGNLKEHKDLYLSPDNVDDIIDFAYNRLGTGVTIALADCIGYYNSKAMEVVQKHIAEDWCWQGCGAGKQSIGILHNGDITACTSLRSSDFIVGNIRERRLSQIWNDPNSFSWNREMKKENLVGLCKKCQYGSMCLGGCTNSRLCMNGSIYSDNKFCSYHVAVSEFESKLDELIAENTYDNLIEEYINTEQYQLAELVIAHKLEIHEDINTLELYAYVNFELENYKVCQQVNEKILLLDENNSYALKGMGLSLIKENCLLMGLEYLFRALKFNSGKTFDPYYDLCVVLKELDIHLLLEELHNEAKKCPDYQAEQFQGLLS
jgi:radical SAM protein with 4Fe4S-binding SPASM domain